MAVDCEHEYLDGKVPKSPCYTCEDCGHAEHVLSTDAEANAADGPHCAKCGEPAW